MRIEHVDREGVELVVLEVDKIVLRKDRAPKGQSPLTKLKSIRSNEKKIQIIYLRIPKSCGSREQKELSSYPLKILLSQLLEFIIVRLSLFIKIYASISRLCGRCSLVVKNTPHQLQFSYCVITKLKCPVLLLSFMQLHFTFFTVSVF